MIYMEKGFSISIHENISLNEFKMVFQSLKFRNQEFK
jgi:hypothetical protein